MYVNPRESNSFIRRTYHDVPSLFTVREAVLEKGSGVINEDTLSIDNDLYIVCDGATSIGDVSDKLVPSGGQQAAAIVAEVFSENDRSLGEMAQRANRKISEAMRQASVDLTERTTLWSTSFAALRFAGNFIEWSQAGDCLTLLIYQDGTGELLAEPPGHDTATLQKWKRIGPGVKGTIHQVLATEIAEVRRAMNRDYGVLNGEDRALDFVRGGVKNINSVKDIILFSDGLWLPGESPGKPLDVSGIIALYNQAGLGGIVDHIRTLQRKDPRCCRFPRFKMHDDISAIALQRSESAYSGSIP